jgi:hypothetical protein
MAPLLHRHPAPRTAPLRAWLLGALSAVSAVGVAWVAQHEPARVVHRPETRVATLEGPREPAMVIRLNPASATGISCLRLRPARAYDAAFGGTALEPSARTSPEAPSSLPESSSPVVFSRAGVEDWPGQAGGDASQP